MKRLGSNVKSMREINHDDTFLGRVKLLIIMLKAFLGDYSLQGISLKAITRNADEVHKVCEDWNQYIIQVRSVSGLKEGIEFDHIFYQRVSLLAIMAKSFVAGNPMGYHRKNVIRVNINYISEALQFNPEEEYTKLLKVA